MLTSIAIIFISGMTLRFIFTKLRLPGLLGMIIAGIIVGPYTLNLLDPSLLSISASLRQLALIVILMRAGLSLNLEDLKKVGRPAILMCFVPACFEIAVTLLFAPKLLGISLLDSAVLGSVIAAVSPAVVVPAMLDLMDKGYGTDKGIPQLIMAGASVDDIFVIVLFTTFTSLSTGGNVSAAYFAKIPISIFSGILIGALLGTILARAFKISQLDINYKVLLLLSISFLLVELESKIEHIIPFSGLLAVMAVGIWLLRKQKDLANQLSESFADIWKAAEILLFVLVGATVDLSYAVAFGTKAIALLFIALLFRMLGVWVSLISTDLNYKERIFTMVAYLPKATVQAAIGGIPLAMGLPAGELILAVAVLSILITAPLGALGIKVLHKNFLTKS